MAHYVFIYPQIQRLTGAQRLIIALANALVGSETKVTILTHRFAAECRPALNADVQLLETGHKLNFFGNHYLDSFIEYGAVPALVSHLPLDTSAICFFGPPSLPGLWWAKNVRRLRMPLLYFCYEPPRAAYTDRLEVTQRMGWVGALVRPLLWLYRPLDGYLAGQADKILVNGEYGRELIRLTYGKPADIIRHGVELSQSNGLIEKIDKLIEQYGLQNQRVILTVNHLHPRKRLDLLLYAMPLILAEHPQTTLLIVGKGPEETALRTLARVLKLTAQQVVFAGFVADSDLAAYYGLGTIYAHSGRAESFGLSVLEACQAGLPVVAADEGGPLEIIVDGKTGFLVEAKPELFANKLNWLLAHPETAEAMGTAARLDTTNRYSWARGAQDFEAAIANLSK